AQRVCGVDLSGRHALDRDRLGARRRSNRRHRRSHCRRAAAQLWGRHRSGANPHPGVCLRAGAHHRVPGDDAWATAGRGPASHAVDCPGGSMKVFVFDLLAYGENLDHLKTGSELPYPLSKRHFRSDVAVRTYAEHLDAWEEMDRLGYDGVGFNEHHCSPYGLMNSPNLMAASAAQRTKKLKLLIYGNLLPLHEPLRLAEELAMLDCL